MDLCFFENPNNDPYTCYGGNMELVASPSDPYIFLSEYAMFEDDNLPHQENWSNHTTELSEKANTEFSTVATPTSPESFNNNNINMQVIFHNSLY